MVLQICLPIDSQLICAPCLIKHLPHSLHFLVFAFVTLISKYHLELHTEMSAKCIALSTLPALRNLNTYDAIFAATRSGPHQRSPSRTAHLPSPIALALLCHCHCEEQRINFQVHWHRNTHCGRTKVGNVQYEMQSRIACHPPPAWSAFVAAFVVVLNSCPLCQFVHSGN